MLRSASEMAPEDLNIRRQLGAIVALNLVHNAQEVRPLIMILSKMTLNNRRKPLTRDEFFVILNASLEAHAFNFARQAALYWLKTYSGDLEVKLTLAQVLFGEEKRQPAIEEVEHLCQIDPCFVSGWQTLAWMTRQMDYERYINALANLKALGQEFHTGMSLPPWGEGLVGSGTGYQERGF